MRARGGPEVLEPSHQTVRLGRGRHRSPDEGACVVELASMLAGERFSDRPAGVCPVIAGFLRSYNDLIPEHELDDLYPYAALVVGTAGPRWARRERAQHLVAWSREGLSRARFYVRFETWDLSARPAVLAALRLDPAARRDAVAGLLEELVAIGRAPEPDRALEARAAADRAGFTPTR